MNNKNCGKKSAGRKLKGAVGTYTSSADPVTDPFNIHIRLNELPPVVNESIDTSGYTIITAYGERFFKIPHNMLEVASLKFYCNLSRKVNCKW